LNNISEKNKVLQQSITKYYILLAKKIIRITTVIQIIFFVKKMLSIASKLYLQQMGHNGTIFAILLTVGCNAIVASHGFDRAA